MRPDLAALLAEPQGLTDLPAKRVAALLAEMAAELTRLAALQGAPLAIYPDTKDRRRGTVPPCPALADLPLITAGPHKSERWMTPQQFAGWCGEPLATIRDRIYKRQVAVEKLGMTRNARLRIASGERERMWARLGQQTRRPLKP